MTKFNYLQGDPALFLNENGADMTFKGGQPAMDQGLHNAVLISYFTKTGWWGNVLTNEESKKISSDFQEQSSKPIIDLVSINDTKQSAERAVKWMKDIGLAGTIDIKVVNPSGQQTVIDTLIQPVGQDVNRLRVSSNGLNWQAQALFPAAGRE